MYVLYGCTVYELYELYGRTQVAGQCVSAVWLYGAMYYYVMHVHALFEPASHTAIQQTRIVPPPLYLVCTVYSSYITYTVQSYSTYTVHLHTPPLRRY